MQGPPTLSFKSDLSAVFAKSGDTVNVLKFRTLVACHKNPDNRAGPDQTASEEAV